MMLDTLGVMEVPCLLICKKTLPKVNCLFYISKIRRNPCKTDSFPKEKWL